jgi:LysM repeat protein
VSQLSKSLYTSSYLLFREEDFMRRIVLVLMLACLALVPAATSSAQNATSYTVQPGDNLFRISLRFGVSVAAIAQANNIGNANLIFVGQVLQIPAGGNPVPVPGTPVPGATTPPPGGQVGTYVVQPGDTLGRIAARFGTTVAAIAQANNIVNPNLIFVGQTLQITGAPASGSNPPPPSSGNNPPPISLTGFEVGGQVLGGVAGSTQNALQTAHMKWVKRQVGAGDGNGPNLIAEAHGAGFKILLSVVGDKNSVTNGGYQDSYANYVGALAQAGADAIEIWNEMNIDREWPTGQISPNSYVSLLSKSYTAIKGKNGNTIVISGALSPTGAEGAFGLDRVWNDDRYYNGMAAAGVGNVADCIGVHYNEGIVSPLQTSGDPRDNYPTRYFSTMLNRAMGPFPGKKACFTELGYLTPEGYGPLPGGFSWAGNTTVAQQAQWLAQAMQSAANSGRVRMVIVFNIDSTNYGVDPQAGYAIIRPGGGCPACNSIGAVLP